MANNHFLASVYATRRGNSAPRAVISPVGVPANQGVQMSFPSAGTIFYPIPQGFTSSNVFNNATTQTIIEVLPSGLNQPSLYYFSSETTAALDTKAI